MTCTEEKPCLLADLPAMNLGATVGTFGVSAVTLEVHNGDSCYVESVWGADVSGSLGGAGGVGGLLSMTRMSSSGTSNYYYCADANGNISDMVDTNGNVVAHYEYSPFGETLVATGPMAAANPWRFSTRYYDTETGLIMYPARPYSPMLGRFLCKDPAQEAGSLNLYEFPQNNPVNQIDPFGLTRFGHLPDGVFPVWYMLGDGGTLYYPDGTEFNSRIRATRPSIEYEREIVDSVLASLIFNRKRCKTGGNYESSQNRSGSELLWAPALEDYDLFLALNRYMVSYKSEWTIGKCCEYKYKITFEGSDTYDFSTLAKVLLIGVPCFGTPFDIRWDWKIVGEGP